jgi:predicted AAA+ superfamily ATPase
MDELLHRFNPWWSGSYRLPGIPRERYLSILAGLKDTRDVVLLTGLRRVGKTTLIHQYISRLLGQVEADRIFYVSLDSLALRNRTILEIVEAFRRVRGLRHDDSVFLFLDEVHLKRDFEVQLKNIYDEGHAKVFASGSSSLDIVMKSPLLTGRQRLLRLPPLDYDEFLQFAGKYVKPSDAHLHVRFAEDYLRTGGIPEFVRTGDHAYLQSLVDSILYRDIAARHNLRSREQLADILAFLAQGVGSPLGDRKISRVLGVPVQSVGRTIDLFIEANLVHAIEKEGKLSERKGSPAKVYLADTGLFQVLTENVNLGAMAENLVLLSIRGDRPPRYHRSNGLEVDFVRGREAWESKYKSVVDEDDLCPMLRLKKFKHRFVITKDSEGTRGGIHLVPLWRFLLGTAGDYERRTSSRLQGRQKK